MALPLDDDAPTRPGSPLTRRTLLTGLGGAWLAGGCTVDPDADHAGPDAPEQRPLGRPVRVAWVLSSGGPRGFMHIGVIQALEELGLQPDLIVGASAGAVVAVLHAGGLRGVDLRALALDLQPLALARLSMGTAERLSAAGIGDWVRGRLDRRRLQDLPIPAACVAHRPSRGDEVAFTSGDAGLAVAASCAIEGQFAPVRIRGDRHVDADLHRPLPVRIARSLGARRVLAVDASAHEDKAPPGTESWRAGDRRKRTLTRPDAAAADLVLHPDIGYYAGLSRDYRQRLMDTGYRETLARADALRALHAA